MEEQDREINAEEFVLNCVPSARTEDDWTFEDAVDAELIDVTPSLPAEMDLRGPWWKIDNQGRTGACVGFATACGVLRWHYTKVGWINDIRYTTCYWDDICRGGSGIDENCLFFQSSNKDG